MICVRLFTETENNYHDNYYYPSTFVKTTLNTVLTRRRGRYMSNTISRAASDQSRVAQWVGSQNASARIPVVEVPGPIPARS